MLIAVRQSRPLADQLSFRYAFPTGIACVMAADYASDIYRRADLALHAAKMGGRDQVNIDPHTRRKS